MPANLLYAAGHDLAHPYLSPLFGNGFPPALTTGTRDLFLSNTDRTQRALRSASRQHPRADPGHAPSVHP
jgi:epsilon-lactone hydrolase